MRSVGDARGLAIGRCGSRKKEKKAAGTSARVEMHGQPGLVYSVALSDSLVWSGSDDLKIFGSWNVRGARPTSEVNTTQKEGYPFLVAMTQVESVSRRFVACSVSN